MENSSLFKEEVLINVTPQETRIAIVENGMLQELQIERMTNRNLVGNIYMGKVLRILPGMQAAFIDIGIEKAAFLHVDEIVTSFTVDKDKPSKDITDIIHQDQLLLVQVLKAPIGTKGARLTTQISLPAQLLVMMPTNDHIGISQRIDDDSEKERLKKILLKIQKEFSFGFIVRTAAEGSDSVALEADAKYIAQQWQDINDRKPYAKPGELIFEQPDLIKKIVRDKVYQQNVKIRIDSNENYQRIYKYIANLSSDFIENIEYYPGERPLFEFYNIEEEIQKSLKRRVDLKSGGSIIIDQTEAMTTIDVNTGAYVGSRNLEETIFKTNLEAAISLARQLRLRNLGGIIIIDFIDMSQEEHKRQVLRALEKALEKDHVKTSISEVSSLGLVQMTRKRTRESLEHTLCESCPICQGVGYIKTSETLCYEIFREILRASRAYETEKIMVLASQKVVDRLLDEESVNVAELEDFIKKPIHFQVETLYFQEQYDVIPV